MIGIWMELRRAGRVLRRSPGFALLVIITLAIGLGANSAIFGVVRSVLLSGLPFDQPSRIVNIQGTNPDAGYLEFGVSLHDFEDWTAGSSSFEAMAAWNTQQANIRIGDQPRRVTYLLATPSLFRVLGVAPARGRVPADAENEPGSDDVVVVSHGFWQEALGGRPDAVGSTVHANGRDMTVVGIMPPGFFFPTDDVAFWKPFGVRPDDAGTRGSRWVAAVGRLADGVTVEQADASLDAISTRLAATWPSSNEGWSARLEPLLEAYISDVRPAIAATWAAVGVLLLIACANVANLLLARTTRRHGEWAVRAALGAGRWRMIREALLESMLLALIGGVAGVGLGWIGLRVIEAFSVTGLVPGGGSFAFDGRVLAYCAALTLLTGLVFGGLPALRGTEAALRGVRTAGRRTAGDGRGRLRGGLVAAETALAMVLVVGATLLLRSFGTLMAVDTGFEAAGRLAFRIAPTMAAYPERQSADLLFGRITDRLQALPGVIRVGATNNLPLSGNRWSTELLIDGVEVADPADRPRGNARVVRGDYFAAIGIPLLRGREFRDTDDAGGQPVAAINRAAAERYFADGDPIGRTVAFDADPRAFRYTIIGVVGNERGAALDTDPGPMVYTPFAQSQFGHFMDWSTSFVVQAAGNAPDLAASVREVVGSIDPSLPAFAVQSLEDRVAADVAQRRFIMVLLSIFGAIALLLAAVGVYGVLSFSVAQRTSEIGIRMTLGADRAGVMGLVLSRGLAWTGTGLAAGTALALLSTRLLATQLYGTAETDVASFATAAIVLAVAAGIACMVPAIRATRVSPVEAIRGD